MKKYLQYNDLVEVVEESLVLVLLFCDGGFLLKYVDLVKKEEEEFHFTKRVGR